MSRIYINKSSSLIEYDDDNTAWTAEVIFDSEKKEVLLLGTTRCLTDIERSNIITEILNKYFFR